MTLRIVGNEYLLDDANMGDLIDVIVSPKIEKLIGNLAEESAVAENGGVVPNEAANRYVNGIGQQLVRHSKRADFGYKFGIVANKAPNAFALPNGSLYVTMGLLRLLRNEAQLANVLGHEVSHVTEKHTVHQLALNMGTLLFLQLADALSKGDKESRKAAKEMVFNLIANGYSRENEWEADEKGQKLAAKAGWDPNGMVDIMAVFQTLEKDHPKGVEEYMRSHPYATERMAEALERAQSLPRGELNGERYQAFLGLLGIPRTEIAQSPVQTASKILPGAPPTATEPIGIAIPSWIWPLAGIAVVGTGALLLLPKLLRR